MVPRCYDLGVARGVVLIVLAGVAVRADAAPVTWADVVGEYRGRLAWKDCNTPGAKQATVALDAIDGALAIDLTRAGGGLRTFSLALDDDATSAWSAQDADVTVQVSRTRANTIALAIEIGDHCQVRGTLARTTTSVEACDRVVAWSRACELLRCPASSNVLGRLRKRCPPHASLPR